MRAPLFTLIAFLIASTANAACEAPRVMKPFTGEGPEGSIYALVETPVIQILDLARQVSDGKGASTTEQLPALPEGGIASDHLCNQLSIHLRTKPSDPVDWRVTEGVTLGVIGLRIASYVDYHILYPAAFAEIRDRDQFRWLQPAPHIAFNWPARAPTFGSPEFGAVLKFYFQKFGDACGDWLIVQPNQILIPACEPGTSG
ncbi:MAG: hypothetical protein AAGC81_11545 [Pseudomonadota bacterium]